jgi:hypothetical protein
MDRVFEDEADWPGNGALNEDGSVDVQDFARRSLRLGRFVNVAMPGSPPNMTRSQGVASESCIAMDGQPRGSLTGPLLSHNGIFSKC